MTQTLGEYTQSANGGIAGQSVDPFDAGDYLFRLNAGGNSVQTVAPITVGGTIGTETFTISPTLNLPEGSTTFTVTTVGSASLTTATLIAADLASKLNANLNFYRVASAAAVAGVITITVRSAQSGKNIFITLVATKTGAATITAAPTLTNFATAASILYGYAVGQAAADADGSCRLYSGSGLLLGLASINRSASQLYAPQTSQNIGLSQISPVDGIPVNGEVQIKRRGRIWALVTDAAVVRGAQVFVNNTTGAVQTTVTGGTALGTSVFLTTTTGASQLAVVQLTGLL